VRNKKRQGYEMKKVFLALFVSFALLTGFVSAGFEDLGFDYYTSPIATAGELVPYGDSFVLYTNGDSGTDYYVDFKDIVTTMRNTIGSLYTLLA
jgi:hypothetical protein